MAVGGTYIVEEEEEEEEVVVVVVVEAVLYHDYAWKKCYQTVCRPRFMSHSS